MGVVRNDRNSTPCRAIQKNGQVNATGDGHRSNRASKSNPNDRSNVESTMAKVRYDMRRPITSLWQHETERARTAPSRTRPSTSTRDLNLRRPSPQGSQGLRGGQNETVRARSAECRGRSFGSASRRMGRPIPLRSSHRVGPVGDMGE